MATPGIPLRSNAPLVVIVGPTASGKTDIALELAEKFDGEIICADSRTIYKDMDIGTAKPTRDEQARVPHWGLDLVEPGERFTAADFKKYADQKISEIRSRGRVPLLVGGTGLYIDAVLFDFKFSGRVNVKLRAKLDRLSVEELQEYCIENNIELPENTKNKRYLVRAIEQDKVSRKRENKPLRNSIIVGITTDKIALDEKIARRTEQLFENGVVDEATKLRKKYNWEAEAFTGNIYRAIQMYLEGTIKRNQLIEKTIILDRQLAKRQRTWFKRNPFIHWLPLEEIEQYIMARLAK